MIDPYNCTEALETIAQKLGFRDAEALPWDWKMAIATEIRAAERRGWGRGYDDAREIYRSTQCR